MVCFFDPCQNIGYSEYGKHISMQNTTIIDILADLENTNSSVSSETHLTVNPAEDQTSITSGFEKNETFIQQYEHALLDLELANTTDLICQSESNTPAQTPHSFAKNTLSNLKSGISIFSRYITVSGVVFAVLLLATNWSAYYTVAINFIHPEGLYATSQQIQNTLSNSKITIYANEVGATVFEKKEKAEDIKKQLDAENIKVNEEPFSMKNLIPTEPNVSARFDITPYENRIIIPRIGKNIPLVDISMTRSFDFDHMENIFMQELEKGVVRYPGSAVPGEKGNAFIFWHSSNYPWLKGDFNDVFALLDNVEFGDQIIVFYNQKKFVYTVREKKIVRPGDVKVLERNPEARELSLMTCWPIGTTLKRMLVFAELTENS